MKILVLPDTLTAINEEAFVEVSVQLVVFQEGGKSVRPHAFADCSTLLAVNIPDTVSEIAEGAFRFLFRARPGTRHRNMLKQAASILIFFPEPKQYQGRWIIPEKPNDAGG